MSAWDEIDAWAEEQRAKQLPPRVRADGISPDRARTLRAAARIEAGYHPNGLRLLPDRSGSCCGNCANLIRKKFSKTYLKCALAKNTNGPGTDVRWTWPACAMWKAAGGDG